MGVDLIPRLVRGKLTEVLEGGVKIAFDGKLGVLSIPSRLVITDQKPAVDDEVEIYLSYARVMKKEGKK